MNPTFDPKTAEIKEYKLPTKWGMPYDVVPTKGAAPKEGPADLAEAIDNLPMSG